MFCFPRYDVVDDGIETPTVHTFVSFNFSEKKGAYMTTYSMWRHLFGSILM